MIPAVKEITINSKRKDYSALAVYGAGDLSSGGYFFR